MTLIHESTVFKTTYDELKIFHTLLKKFSKSERYSLGEKLENSLLNILLEIISAGNARNEWKIAAIDRALVHLERSKILLRLASDIEQIAMEMYLERSEAFQKIGRMLGGWKIHVVKARSIQSRLSQAFPDEEHRTVLRIRDVRIPVRVQLRVVERIHVGTVVAIVRVDGPSSCC
ncbi:MAG: four helix bundle protein [Patescibacteria group bacterium]